MKIQGRIKVGTKTKELSQFLQPGEIAVIQQDDIDELAAEALICTGIKAVINTGKSMTGEFLSLGTKMLFENSVKVIDTILPISCFRDNDLVTVLNRDIIIKNNLYKGVCSHVNSEYIRQRSIASEKNLASLTSKFIENTIIYAALEKDKIINYDGFPELNTRLKGRHALVVVRNADSKEELKSLKLYIEKYNPVLIGVDGGADILINSGYTPDITVGDMDSVTDIGLLKSRELVLHSYENCNCPCLERISRLNLPYKIAAMTGTSEDVALMLAYRKGAELIVLVGGHSSVQDFLAKGRQGMGSTMITRLVIGDRLVDCKGMNRLLIYESNRKDYLWAKM